MHTKTIRKAGKGITPNGKVLILLHGRGGRAEDMFSLASNLNVDDFSLLAPQATNNTWYPYSFLAPTVQNEPWLSSALALLNELVDDVTKQSVPTEHVYFLGFSQGACLALEFVARNAQKYGGVVAFTGGLIGEEIHASQYAGDFQNTPFFIGTSNPDPHVPVSRVEASATVLTRMNAAVMTRVYPGMPHTISQDELDQANTLVFNSSPVTD